MASSKNAGQSIRRRRALARAFREAAAKLIAGMSWDEFATVEEPSSLDDDDLRAMEVAQALAGMFEKAERSKTDADLLARLQREVVPRGFREEDGRRARALDRINAEAERVQTTVSAAAKAKITRRLLADLDDLGFQVAKCWASSLRDCTTMLERLELAGGPHQPAASGVLADLLIRAQPVDYPAADRKRIVDRLSASARRGRRSVES
ncbi:MAG: hypothetical protein KIT84_11035 [Labilithrix sp.]|nr:hypothetical protein [Labilithrix sp.]MCW5811542.1 hypothetical protein [Labilithrix sp.]